MGGPFKGPTWARPRPRGRAWALCGRCLALWRSLASLVLPKRQIPDASLEPASNTLWGRDKGALLPMVPFPTPAGPRRCMGYTHTQDEQSGQRETGRPLLGRLGRNWRAAECSWAFRGTHKTPAPTSMSTSARTFLKKFQAFLAFLEFQAYPPEVSTGRL